MSTLFISTWATTEPNVTLALPLESWGTYNFTIDWGDASPPEQVGSANASHSFATAGRYNLTVDGTLVGFRFNNAVADKDKIVDIVQWGNLDVGNSGGYFFGCTNMACSAMDALNLTGVTDLSSAFYHADRFNSNVSRWDLSGVTTMDSAFTSVNAFAGDVLTWDVSRVTAWAYCFYEAASFDGDVSAWNMSKVTLFLSLHLFLYLIMNPCPSHSAFDPLFWSR
jgi:hypothetical protein